MSMYYKWRTIEGYNAPITVVIGPRGLGKTFGKVLQQTRVFAETGQRFVYVVETLEDLKTLSQNKGERFFAGIKEYLETSNSNRSKWLYNRLFGGNSSEIEEGETDLVDKENNKILGGTIKCGDETMGYLIALNSYGNLKRNNFVNIKTIIIDEFIPEQIDIRHLEMTRKVASVIQTVARMKNVKIYMLGNSIRLDDILLVKLGLANMRVGEIRVIKDEYGPLVVGHYVDRSEYEEFSKKADQSVAGRLAKLLKEDNLDKNEFKGEVSSDLLIPAKPKRSSLLFCLHGEGGLSIRINATKDYSEFYIMSDYGDNKTKRYCFEEKYMTGVVQYRPEWKEVLSARYSQNSLKFESSVIHTAFKTLMKLDINI